VSAAEKAETWWWSLAACRGRTTLFFASDEFSQRCAVEVCRRCPVRRQCLADAVATEGPGHRGERYGVVAGLTAEQRRGWD
jgi:WhiB family redox-sensing transcriptional regulator